MKIYIIGTLNLDIVIQISYGFTHLDKGIFSMCDPCTPLRTLLKCNSHAIKFTVLNVYIIGELLVNVMCNHHNNPVL